MPAVRAYLCCLLFAFFVAPLPGDSASCTSGYLLDSTATSASLPGVSVPSLPIMIKVIDSLTISFIHVFLIDNDQSNVPSVASLHDDASGTPSGSPFYSSTNGRVVSTTEYQIDMGNTNLNSGVYWLVFTAVQPGGVMAGWTWSAWSGVDDFHSLSFADSYSQSGLVPRVVIRGCGTILAGVSPTPPPPSPPPSSAVSPSPPPSPPTSPSSTPMRSLSVTPLASPSRTAYVSYSPSASPSVSPSSLPPLTILANATAEFDQKQAAFQLSGTFGSHLQSQHLGSSVQSRLSSLHLGNVTLLADELSENMTREIVPAQGDAPSAYIYSVRLDDGIHLHQSFAFHKRHTNSTFAGVDFVIPANSVKWSLNFTSDSSSVASRCTTVRYRLNSPGLAPASNARTVSRANTPATGLTTYLLPLNSDPAQPIVATVVLFDLAVVDGVVTTIRHNITATTAGEYEVAVALPAFSAWVHYDPSVGMGALLGSDGGGGGSDNTGLIIGVSVAVPVAVAVIVVAIAAGVAIGWYKRRSLWVESTVNFSDGNQFADAGEL